MTTLNIITTTTDHIPNHNLENLRAIFIAANMGPPYDRSSAIHDSKELNQALAENLSSKENAVIGVRVELAKDKDFFIITGTACKATPQNSQNPQP